MDLTASIMDFFLRLETILLYEYSLLATLNRMFSLNVYIAQSYYFNINTYLQKTKSQNHDCNSIAIV